MAQDLPAPEPLPITAAQMDGPNPPLAYAWLSNGQARPRRLWHGLTVHSVPGVDGSPFLAGRLQSDGRSPGRWNPPAGFQLHRHDTTTDELVGWYPYDAWHVSIKGLLRTAIRDQGPLIPPGTFSLIGDGTGGDDERDADGNPRPPTLVAHEDATIDVFLDDARTLTYPVIADRARRLARTLGWSGIVWSHHGVRVAIRAADLDWNEA